MDFTYIDDLIQGVRLVIEKKESYNEIFNLTYGKSEKNIKLAKLIASEFGVNIKFKQRDKLMPFRGTLDIGLAKKKLAYKPNFNIDAGIKRYIKWYKTKNEI